MTVLNVTITDAVSISLPVVEEAAGFGGPYTVVPEENFADMIRPGQKCSVVSGNSPALSCVRKGTIQRISRNNGNVIILL